MYCQYIHVAIDFGLFVSVNLSIFFFLLLFAILSIFHYYEGAHFDMVSFSVNFHLSFLPLTFIQFICIDGWFVEIMFHLLLLLLLLFLFLSFVWTLTLINSFSFVMLAILLYYHFHSVFVSFSVVSVIFYCIVYLFMQLDLFLIVIKTCHFVVACRWLTSFIVFIVVDWNSYFYAFSDLCIIFILLFDSLIGSDFFLARVKFFKHKLLNYRTSFFFFFWYVIRILTSIP